MIRYLYLKFKLNFLSIVFILLFVSPNFAQNLANSESIIYRCKKGKTFQVKFSKNHAQLTLKPNQVYKLQVVPSASGAKYSNKKIELYTKDEDAFIQINKKIMYDGCTSKLPDLTRPVRYNCDSQVAPFLNKESMTLEQAEKLLVRRDGNLFIYHCYPVTP